MTKEDFFKLLDRYLAGEASNSEIELLDQFYDSYHHEKISKQWDLQNKEYIKIQMYRNILANIRSDENQSLTYGYVRYTELAATFFLIVTSTVLILFYVTIEPSIAMITQVTSYGQKKLITLSDGSMIHLNAGSQLEYPREFDSLRYVYLKGEAFFEIKKQPQSPFIVYTGPIQTRVLGTSFNIKSYDSMNVIITVRSGKVSVQKEKVALSPTDYTLVAGDQISFYEGQEFEFKRVNPDHYTAWKDGRLIFNEMPLLQVAEELERWYGVNIIFENGKLKKCQLTSEINNEPLIRVLDALKIAGDLEYRLENNIVYWSGNGCN